MVLFFCAVAQLSRVVRRYREEREAAAKIADAGVEATYGLGGARDRKRLVSNNASRHFVNLC